MSQRKLMVVSPFRRWLSHRLRRQRRVLKMAGTTDSSKAVDGLTEEIKKLHADLVAEIHKRELSSSENFDRSVLTFSSAGLALSIGFLKDFIPIQVAALPWALYLSWGLFTLATCSTMSSFLVSSLALADQKKLAYIYYIERDESAFDKNNKWDRVTRILNYASGAAFLLAMIATTVFISVNLEKGSNMKQTMSHRTTDGVGVPRMQAVQTEILNKGLTIPTMQQIPSAPVNPAPPAAAPTTGSTGAASTGGPAASK